MKSGKFSRTTMTGSLLRGREGLQEKKSFFTNDINALCVTH
jgi:hypothetical protein